MSTERIAWGDKNGGVILFNAINECILYELYHNNIIVNPNKLDNIFKVFYKSNQEISGVESKNILTIYQKIMDRFDGYDFADIVRDGKQCKEDINN